MKHAEWMSRGLVKMARDVGLRWVAGLRSGKFTQGHGALAKHGPGGWEQCFNENYRKAA